MYDSSRKSYIKMYPMKPRISQDWLECIPLYAFREEFIRMK